ncbi:MAG: macro domain-containing protein [Planctomycetes bacterium]|nr:macro domain-containing protein [Planctomycetota bacterium]
MSIKVLIGNLFESKSQTLVNTVNCIGIMGKGIAQEFKKHYPEMFKDYKSLCDRGAVQLGQPYIFRTLYDKAIINFPTKKHWRSVSRVEDIINGLDYFIEKYKEWGVTSIAFPPLGCGNGGLEWDVLGPLMYQKLSSLDIDVEIYAPYGTSNQKITEKFLASHCDLRQRNTRNMHKQKVKPEWLPLLEIIYRLQKQPYANPVGRTIFQKICYTVTEMEVDTGFVFRQSAYGPFSPQIKSALTVLANSNLIFEKQLGRMTALRIGSEYEKLRNQNLDVIDRFHNIIEKVTDLFIRIKNTHQAEEVSTVLFSCRQLKQETKRVRVSEEEVFNYIMNWKKSWNTEEKKYSVASAIRNLGMLSWIKTDFSASLDVGGLEI